MPSERYQATSPTEPKDFVPSLTPVVAPRMVLPAPADPPRRSLRTSKVPDRLTASYLRAPQGRAPLLGSSAYATFPFPDQPIIPSFPSVVPDIGPDPVTYREEITSPDCDMWQMAIQ